MMGWLQRIALAMLMLAAWPACAQVEIRTTAVERVPSQKQVLGAQHRDTVARAIRAAKRGERKDASSRSGYHDSPLSFAGSFLGPLP